MTENAPKSAVYKINFLNSSPNSGTFMVFQQDPDLKIENLESIAWITKYAHPNTRGTFTWTPDLDFVWMEKTAVAPGIVASTSQCVPADLNTMNSITLTYDEGYNFIKQAAADPAGSLYINEDNSIPLKQAAVGIGMSGAPTFLVQAQPNMTLVFAPHPEYWVAFGDFEQNEVLDLQEITNHVKIDFPPGIFEMNVVLNKDNTWTVGPV